MPENKCPLLLSQFRELQLLKCDFESTLCDGVKNKGFSRAKTIQLEAEKKFRNLQDKVFVSMKRAEKIMGGDFYGPQEIKDVFRVELNSEEIPPIPYTPKILEQAKKLGEMLVLRISHDGTGNPLTMERIIEIAQSKMGSDIASQGTFLMGGAGYENNKFFKKDFLKTGWKLVGQKFVPGVLSSPMDIERKKKYLNPTLGNNYIHQTKILRDYMESIGSLTEKEAKQCSDDLLKELSERMGIDWESQEITDYFGRYKANARAVAAKLSKLLVNRNHRRHPAEIVYDSILRFYKTKDMGVLHDYDDWSYINLPGLALGDHFLYVGRVNKFGGTIHTCAASEHNSCRGVIPVRGYSPSAIRNFVKNVSDRTICN